jgi:hypothetical protein
MQQPQVTTYAAIGEVRTVAGAAACNQLLAEGKERSDSSEIA